LCGSGLVTANPEIGTLFGEFEIEFKDSQSSDNSSLIMNAKGQAASGNAIVNATTTTSYNWAQQLIQNYAGQISNSGQYEISYNPKYWNQAAGTYRLPVGVYCWRSEGGYSTGATVSVNSTTPNFGNCVESDWTNGGVISDTKPPEFTVAATGGATITSKFMAQSYFRITAVTTGVYATFMPRWAATFTGGPAAVSVIHETLMRMPDFLTSPLVSIFPLGNSSGIGLERQDLFEVSIHNGIPAGDVGSKRASIRCPRKYCTQMQDRLVKRWMDDPEDFGEIHFDIRHVGDVEEKAIQEDYAQYVDSKDEKIDDPSDSEPEVIENPLTKSVHVNASAARRLLSMVTGKDSKSESV